jgi:WD40 repeat protein
MDHCPSSTERKAPFQYWAFISYSSKDRAWAKWLHGALENYRLPVQFVKHLTPTGEPAPSRLKPLFWDRAELQAHHDLGELIERSLRGSRYLIVICSPNAAQSPWVEKEIQTFQQMHGPERILSLIIDGEPNARDATNCFPPTLRALEPKASDARPLGDGKTNAKLMLMATMLGVGFDQLKQRHVRRQRVLFGQVATGLLLAALCLLWWWHGEQLEKEAIVHKNFINQRVEAGRQELMGGEPARALAWLRSAYQDGQRDVITRYLLAQTLSIFETPHYSVASSADRFTGAFFVGSSDYLITTRANSRDSTLSAENGIEVATLRLKGSPVPTIPMSRPKSKVAFSFEGNDLRCLNIASGKTISVLKGHTAIVVSATASEKLIITCSADMTARIWQTETGELVATTPVQKAAITCAHFSPDDMWLAVGCADGGMTVWNTRSGTLNQELGSLGSGITKLVMSDDGRALAAEALNGSVTAWATDGWQIIGKLAPSTARARAVFFGHTEAPVAVVIADDQSHVMKVTNLADGRTVREFKGHSAPIGRVCVSDAGDVIASQAMDRTVRVWDVASGRCTHVFEAAGGFSPFEALGQHMDLAPDGGRLLRLGADGRLVVWRISNAIVLPAQSNGNGGQQVVSDARGNVLLGWNASQAWLWSAEPPRLMHMWNSPDNSIVNAGVNAEGTTAVIVMGDGSLRVWDVLLGKVGEPIAPVWGFDFLPNGNRCVAGLADDEIAVLDLTGWQESKRFRLPRATDERAASGISRKLLRASPDGASLAVSLAGTSVHLFALPSGSLIRTFRTEAKDGVQDIRWNPNGTSLLVSNQNTAELWSREGVHLFTGKMAHEFTMLSTAFSSGGRWFATAGGDGFVHIYNTNSGALQSSVKAGSTFVNAISFSRNEELVMTSSNEGGVMIWNVQTGQPLSVLPGMIGHFSPSGRHTLISGTSALIIPLRLEDRSVEQIAKVSQGFSAWEVRDEKLVPAPPTLLQREDESRTQRR